MDQNPQYNNQYNANQMYYQNEVQQGQQPMYIGSNQPVMVDPMMQQQQPYLQQPLLQNQQPPTGIPVGQPYPQQPPMAPMYQQQNQTTNHLQTKIKHQRNATNFYCQNCKQEFVSIVRFQAGDGTFIMAGILCIFTGCCCIPFCVQGCQDAVHFCPRCNCEVGRVKYKIA